MPRSMMSMNSALVIGDAAARAAHGEGGPDDGGQADVVEDRQRLAQRLDLMRARRLKADAGHRLAEQFAVLGHVDGFGAGPDHLDVEFVEDAHFFRESAQFSAVWPPMVGSSAKPPGMA